MPEPVSTSPSDSGDVSSTARARRFTTVGVHAHVECSDDHDGSGFQT
jgi:hypothetical protein